MRQTFKKIPDSKSGTAILLTDHLMSGLAIFGLEDPSILQFDQNRNIEITRSNSESLYGIQHTPCDTYLRERLDKIDPKHLRKNYTYLLQMLQREPDKLFYELIHLLSNRHYIWLDIYCRPI